MLQQLREERSWMIMKEHSVIELWQEPMQKDMQRLHRPGSWGPLARRLRRRLSPYLGPEFSEEEIWRPMTYRVNITWSTWRLPMIKPHSLSFILREVWAFLNEDILSFPIFDLVENFKDNNFRLWLCQCVYEATCLGDQVQLFGVLLDPLIFSGVRIK